MPRHAHAGALALGASCTQGLAPHPVKGDRLLQHSGAPFWPGRLQLIVRLLWSRRAMLVDELAWGAIPPPVGRLPAACPALPAGRRRTLSPSDVTEYSFTLLPSGKACFASTSRKIGSGTRSRASTASGAHRGPAQSSAQTPRRATALLPFPELPMRSRLTRRGLQTALRACTGGWGASRWEDGCNHAGRSSQQARLDSPPRPTAPAGCRGNRPASRARPRTALLARASGTSCAPSASSQARGSSVLPKKRIGRAMLPPSTPSSMTPR